MTIIRKYSAQHWKKSGTNLSPIDNTTNITLPKTSGLGIKVDTSIPTFGWRDLIGEITNAGGANKPLNVTYNGGITQFQFAAGDESILVFHIPHDYVMGTDISTCSLVTHFNISNWWNYNIHSRK